MRKLLGILAALAVVFALPRYASAANIVVNPGFETGNFAGWTQSGNTGFTGVTGGAVAHSGAFGAFFGPIGSEGFIAQNLATTAGATYSLSYWLTNQSGLPPNSFRVLINGVTIASLTNAAAFAYTLFSVNFVATGASTNLQFGFRHDPSFWFFDDVTVDTSASAIPEPASLLLLGTGLAVATRRLRRRSAK